MTKSNTPINHTYGGGRSSYSGTPQGRQMKLAMTAAVGTAVMKMTAVNSGRWHQWQQRGADCRWNTPTINWTDNRDRRMRKTQGVVMMPEEQGDGGCSDSGDRGEDNHNEDERGGRGRTVPVGLAQGDWKTTKATIN
jgi:hypothetical protein